MTSLDFSMNAVPQHGLSIPLLVLVTLELVPCHSNPTSYQKVQACSHRCTVSESRSSFSLRAYLHDVAIAESFMNCSVQEEGKVSDGVEAQPQVSGDL